MDLLNALIIVLLASSAVGMGVSFIIQLGKLFLPKYFPDTSADNWRLGLVVLIAVGVLIARTAGVQIEMSGIESAATALAALGSTLMPLLVLIANWIAKATYNNALRGTSAIGKSYSLKNSS